MKRGTILYDPLDDQIWLVAGSWFDRGRRVFAFNSERGFNEGHGIIFSMKYARWAILQKVGEL